MSIDCWFDEVIREILCKGEDRETRSGKVKSVFNPPQFVSAPLYTGKFPIWSIKKTLFKKPLREGLFFLTGSTLVNDMPTDIRNTWWKPWTENNDDLGKFYGYQLRQKQGYFDQIRWLENEIKTNPFGRRHVISAFNNAEINETVLPSCHMSLWQFYVTKDGVMNMFAYSRSQDLLLGTPHNIVWAAQFLIMFSQSVGYHPGVLTYQMGDTHIYSDHLEQSESILNNLEDLEVFPEYEVKPEYKGLDIESLILRSEQNCENKNLGFDCPLILKNYYPVLKNLKLPLSA